MVRFLLLIVVNFALIVGGLTFGGFRLNLSNSQPVGLYREVSGGWDRGDLVFSCLPQKVAAIAVERGYLSTNAVNCGGHTPVLKRVMALPGDRVDIADQVFINGKAVPNSDLQEADSLGRGFEMASSGPVADGQVWLIGNEIRYSWDSRYFGPVHQSLIMAKVRPVWTF